MLSYLKSLIKPNIDPLNEITISRSAILHNLKTLQSLHPGEAIFPVLKSNAYGHGLKEMATILKESDVPYICVDSFPEYQIVRDYAKKKSLILGETLANNYLAYDPRWATPCVYNYDTIKVLGQSGKQRNIHLFLNTGMNREGIQEEDLPKILELLAGFPNLRLEGIMSHFANADEVDDSMDHKQIETFTSMLGTIKNSQQPTTDNRQPMIHIANSAGTLKYNSSQTGCNARRCGLALYGYNPLPPTTNNQQPTTDNRQPTTDNRQLFPALSVTSTIISTQQLKTGDIVSYGGKRTAPYPCFTATLPFGYFEGLPRNVTNKRGFSHDGLRHPQIGTICMNLSCYTTGTIELPIGTKVMLIGKPTTDNGQPISGHPTSDNGQLPSLASLSSTIPYEILTGLHPSIRRRIDD